MSSQHSPGGVWVCPQCSVVNYAVCKLCMHCGAIPKTAHHDAQERTPTGSHATRYGGAGVEPLPFTPPPSWMPPQLPQSIVKSPSPPHRRAPSAGPPTSSTMLAVLAEKDALISRLQSSLRDSQSNSTSYFNTLQTKVATLAGEQATAASAISEVRESYERRLAHATEYSQRLLAERDAFEQRATALDQALDRYKTVLRENEAMRNTLSAQETILSEAQLTAMELQGRLHKPSTEKSVTVAWHEQQMKALQKKHDMDRAALENTIAVLREEITQLRRAPPPPRSRSVTQQTESVAPRASMDATNALGDPFTLVKPKEGQQESAVPLSCALDAWVSSYQNGVSHLMIQPASFAHNSPDRKPPQLPGSPRQLSPPISVLTTTSYHCGGLTTAQAELEALRERIKNSAANTQSPSLLRFVSSPSPSRRGHLKDHHSS